MRTFCIVICSPFLTHLPDFIKTVELICIQQLPSQASVFSLNKSVLHGLSWLDVFNDDPIGLTPLQHFMTYKLRPIICPKTRWLAPALNQLLKYTHHSLTWQGCVHFYAEGLPVKVIHHIEQSELPSVCQRVAHKVQAPGLIWFCWCDKRIFNPVRQALLRSAADVQVHAPVDSSYLLMVLPVTPGP